MVKIGPWRMTANVKVSTNFGFFYILSSESFRKFPYKSHDNLPVSVYFSNVIEDGAE